MDYNEMPQNNYSNGNNVSQDMENPLSFGEWLITLIVLAIPVIGFIMLLVWGFGNGNKSRRNYCRAALVLAVIGIILSVLLYSAIASVIFSALSSAAI